MTTFSNGESGLSVRNKINDAIEKVDGTQAIPSIDINGGTIDGTVIGGSTPAAISGTTGQFGTSLNVDGIVTADGLALANDAFLVWGTGSGRPAIIGNEDTDDMDFFIQGNKAINISGGGDISFFEDTGTTPKFYWDASAERLGLGTVIPRAKLDVFAGETLISNGTSGTPSTGGTLFLNTGGSGTSRAAGVQAVSTDSANGHALLLFTNASGATPTERLRIDAGGNVGIGVVPESWFVPLSTRALQIGGTTSLWALSNGSTDLRTTLDNNLYVSAATGQNTYLNTGPASRYQQVNGSHVWLSAVSGTADAAATVSERARIDASGNLLVGTTTAAGLTVGSVSAAGAVSASGPLTSHQTNMGALDYNNNVFALRAYGATPGTGVIAFKTGGGGGSEDTERARIDASGNLLVGTTARRTDEKVVFVFNGTTGSGLNLDDSSSVGTSQAQLFHRNGGLVGTITTSLSTTAYNTSSDYRLKEDVQPMSGASDRVLALKPVNFAWKVDGSRVDGFLAHEAQAVVPEAVTGKKDGEEMQAIDQSKLVPLLTAALQEALQKIEALEARITALEA